MLIAPAASLFGVVPFLFQLNLTFGQFISACLFVLILAYVGGLVVGGLGYLILRALGFSESRYLIAYAVLFVVLVALLYGDVYVLVSFGPPVLLAAGAFCYLRGSGADSDDVFTSSA
jgi:hypothetical protein